MLHNFKWKKLIPQSRPNLQITGPLIVHKIPTDKSLNLHITICVSVHKHKLRNTSPWAHTCKPVQFAQPLIPITAPQHTVGSKVMLIQTCITMVNMLYHEAAKYFISSKAQCWQHVNMHVHCHRYGGNALPVFRRAEGFSSTVFRHTSCHLPHWMRNIWDIHCYNGRK